MIGFVVVLFLQTADVSTAPPVPDFKKPIDYHQWMDDTVRGKFKPEDNAAPLYAKLFGDMSSTTENVGESLGFRGPHTKPDEKVKECGPWDPVKHDEWEEAYHNTKSLLADFREAAAKPYSLAPIAAGDRRGLLMDRMLPDLSPVRACVKGDLENAWRAPDGKVDAADMIDACRTGFAVARQLDRDPVLISQLVAIACRALVYDDLRLALKHGVFAQSDRPKVVSMLSESDQPIAPFRRGIYGESAAGYDLLQALSGSSGAQPQSPELVALANRLKNFDPAPSLKAMKEYYAGVIAASERSQAAGAAKAEMEKLEERLGPATEVTKVVLPALSRAFVLRARCVTMQRAVRLLYEVHAYKDKTGKWPQTLDALGAEIVKKFGTDPFSNKPLVYKLVNGEPMLYSVALNGKDDGGKHDPKWGDSGDADFVMWPMP